jgi:chromosome segregation ATPase
VSSGDRTAAAAATSTAAETQRAIAELKAERRKSDEDAARATREEMQSTLDEQASLLSTHTQQMTAMQQEQAELARSLRDELAKLRDENAKLRAENAAVRAENTALRADVPSKDELAATVERLEAALDGAKEDVTRHAAAIQHVANMVTQNSHEDEATAEKINARIDGLEKRLR